MTTESKDASVQSEHTAMDASVRSELAVEARRLLTRYIEEVVLPLGLCPWAVGSLSSGKLLIEPICAGFFEELPASQAAAFAQEVLAAASQEERIELVMIPFPGLRMSRVEFDEVARSVRKLDREGRFALAAFHPEGTQTIASADQAVTFLRRSPDPMLQAVRSDVISKINPGQGEGTSFVSALEIATMLAQGPKESLRSRILSANWATLTRLGVEEVGARIESIHRDRDATYRRISSRGKA
ncbi:MAG: hypothetical protein B6A08_04755 [Sorangiineae bacterium NIC37A_2]|jgi:hypothetical protein|nr:MAG: hypothetical protein B6A08_04755 [Sorangiineae bacterium NIC37A_2]